MLSTVKKSVRQVAAAVSRKSAAQLAATINRREANRAQKAAELEAIKKAIPDLAARALDGDVEVAAPELEAARNRESTLKSEIAMLDAALESDRAKHADALLVEQDQAHALAWKRAKTHGEQKIIPLAAEIVEDVRALASKQKRLTELFKQLHDTVPAKPREGITYNPWSARDQMDYFRFLLLKEAGWRWAFRDWVWSAEKAPDFLEKIREAVAFVLSKRPGGSSDVL